MIKKTLLVITLIILIMLNVNNTFAVINLSSVTYDTKNVEESYSELYTKKFKEYWWFSNNYSYSIFNKLKSQFDLIKTQYKYITKIKLLKIKK